MSSELNILFYCVNNFVCVFRNYKVQVISLFNNLASVSYTHLTSVFTHGWPKYDESKLKEETVNIAVQINGKVKVQLSVDPNADKDTVLAAAKAALGDKLSGNIVKEIYVPGRIVNIVVK